VNNKFCINILFQYQNTNTKHKFVIALQKVYVNNKCCAYYIKREAEQKAQKEAEELKKREEEERLRRQREEEQKVHKMQ